VIDYMKIEINKGWIRYIEYAGYRICIYPKKITSKAVEFHLLDSKNRITRETVWIPKSSIENGKEGVEYYRLHWIFDNPENRDKLERIGYRL